jgi:tetratricopeptide (TPR) repeat protein
VQALEAYGYPTCEEAAATARAALAISPICPEAYNVLALSEASSYEEALQLYRKAEELGPQVCYMPVMLFGCFQGCISEMVLALSEASSCEEALQLYQKAEELGPQVCYMHVICYFSFVLHLSQRIPYCLSKCRIILDFVAGV